MQKMKMKNTPIAAYAAIALTLTSSLAFVPAAFAGQTKSATKKKAAPATAAAAATQYECQKCHMQYSAADAKKNHYEDPMDGGQLVAVKKAVAPKSGSQKKPDPMKMK